MFTRVSLAPLMLLLVLLPSLAPPAQAKAGEVIRVGVTEYQNVEDVYSKYQSLFRDLAEASGGAATFSVAVGTYGEVIDWYNKKQIDVAVLAAQPVADMLSTSSAHEVDLLRQSYVATLGSVPDKCNLLELYSDELKRRRSDDADPMFFKYRTAGVVDARTAEDVKDFEDIKGLVARGQKFKFLFVRPYSISGYVLPKFFLKGQGIDVDNDPAHYAYDFTFQHKNSLKRLLNPSPEDAGYRLVAFVLDMTGVEPKESECGAGQFRKLTSPSLDSDESLIPQQVVVVNPYLKGEKLSDDPERYKDRYEKYKDLMRRLFRKREEGRAEYERVKGECARPSGPGGQTPPAARCANLPNGSFAYFRYTEEIGDWLTPYSSVREWLKSAELPRQLLYKSTFDDFIVDLEKSKTKPRLALVLSGGGAKCSYQAGAIAAIEKRLKGSDLNIGLVVGTSGGAINTLFTAMGLTADPEGARELGDVWASFDQRDFFRPSFIFNLIFGLTFGLAQATVITVAVFMFGSTEPGRWRTTGGLLAAAALLESLLAAYFSATAGQVAGMLWRQAVVLLCVAASVIVYRLVMNSLYIVLGRRLGWQDIRPLNEWRLAGWLMLLLSGLELIIAVVSMPVDWPVDLAMNHTFLHLWMVLKLSSMFSAPMPLLIGAIMLFSGRRPLLTIGNWRLLNRVAWSRPHVVVSILSVAVFVFSFIFLLHAFFKDSSPTEASGIEQAFANKIPDMIVSHLRERLNEGKLTPDERRRTQNSLSRVEAVARDATLVPKKKLEAVSNIILDNDSSMLQRDMVITLSRIPADERAYGASRASDPAGTMSANDLPDDLYFFYRSDPGGARPMDKRFVPLKYNAPKLLDLVIGSSTIYPFFPPRTLEDVRVGNEDNRDTIKVVPQMSVIDGGFIHNSPIEAAIKWGATHIILIEASPKPVFEPPHNFLQNVFFAFKYLFVQSQRLDTLSRGSVEIFELRPTSPCEQLSVKSMCNNGPDSTPDPNMDTFDFSSKLVADSYAKGMRDADTYKPLFVRVPGQPLFRDVAPETPVAAGAAGH